MDSHPFRFLRSLGRSREIATVLLKHGFGDLVERLHLQRYLQWGRRVIFWRKAEPGASHTRAERIRLALETLGATFIKFGQVISTRPDLGPADVIRELSRLQEHVPAFASDLATAVIQEELGRPVSALFAEFDPVPIAAGSLGQVHRARHFDGTLLAVKIRRPNVVRDVERDLSLMFELALLIERHIPEAQVFDPVGLVNQFARTIRRELNFMREGRTIQEFAHLFRHDATLRVPRVYSDLTSEAVLTMEFIDGYRVDDSASLIDNHICAREVAANGARIYLKQTFEFGFFHGDPHPGNIRILPDGSICLLDYGMVGVLEDERREQLVDLFLAVSRQDVGAAVHTILTIGEPRRAIDLPLLRADVRDFVENHYGVALDRLNVAAMLSDFVSILSNHGIQCPADIMLLIRALVTLEGVGRDLDPGFNLAEYLAPCIENIVRQRYDPQHIARRVLQETRTFLRLAHDVPLYLGRSLEKLSKDDLQVQFQHTGLDHFITEIDRSSNRVVIGVVMSSLIVASAIVIRSSAASLLFSIPLFALWSLLGIWLIYGVFRSGRL